MAHEPKKRHSRQRKGKRRAGISLTLVKAVICANCSTPHSSHSVCSNCGFYNGKLVVEPKKKDPHASHDHATASK